MAKLGDERVALIAEYTRGYSTAHRRRRRSLATQGAGSRQAAEARSKAKCFTRVKTALSAADGAAVPAGRASAAAAHRSADLGLAADRQVTERTNSDERSTTAVDGVLLVLATSVSLSADRVRLRSGKVVEGMFMGARQQVGPGAARRRAACRGADRRRGRGGVLGAEAGRRRRPPSLPPQATPPPRLPRRRRRGRPRPESVTVPAGTPVNVRLTQAIDVDTSQAGMTIQGDRRRSR